MCLKGRHKGCRIVYKLCSSSSRLPKSSVDLGSQTIQEWLSKADNSEVQSGGTHGIQTSSHNGEESISPATGFDPDLTRLMLQVLPEAWPREAVLYKPGVEEAEQGAGK